MITNDVCACDDVKGVIARRTIVGDEIMNAPWFIAVDVEAPGLVVCAVDNVVAAAAATISKRTHDIIIYRC